jgi:glycosyltransferase involved in cell wall biosynthesis
VGTNRIALVMPAWNEESAIGKTVLSYLAHGDVVVVDDGSTDTTATVAANVGAYVVKLDENVGYDRALMSGMAYAWSQGYQVAITVDADGQHYARDVEYFVERIANGANVVVGKRPEFQRVAERIFSVFATRFWGVTDPLCGMKGYDLAVFSESDFKCEDETVGTKLLAIAIRRRLCVEQHQISVGKRRGASKFGTGVRPNVKILFAMFNSIKIAHLNK